MNRQQRRASKISVPPAIRTVADAYDACPFRSLVSIAPGTRDELLDRVGGAFAAVNGDVEPIAPDSLADLAATVLAGRTVMVLGTRADLRDAAKAQIMAAVNVAALGAAGAA